MTKVGNRKYLDWAGDRECGTEARALKVAKQLGLASVNSQKDANQMNAECRKQNKPEPLEESGPTFAGSNADGQGLTPAEWDLYAKEKLFGIQAASSKQLQDSVNSTSLTLQHLRDEAGALVQDSSSARNTYSENAASWRTQYSIDAQERWNNFGKVMDYKGTTDAQKIKGEYDISIRKIMNAGNESVAKIQGEYSTANTRLQGEYNLAGENVRGAAARDVAQRNKEASIFGSFLGGFWS